MIKRLFSMAALLALIASPAAAKTCICHVEGTDDAHLILVSDSSVPAHLEQHGDCVVIDQDLCADEDDTCSPFDAGDDGTCDLN